MEHLTITPHGAYTEPHIAGAEEVLSRDRNDFADVIAERFREAFDDLSAADVAFVVRLTSQPAYSSRELRDSSTALVKAIALKLGRSEADVWEDVRKSTDANWKTVDDMLVGYPLESMQEVEQLLLSWLAKADA